MQHSHSLLKVDPEARNIPVQVVKANGMKKIETASDKEILETLAFVFVLIGLKNDSLPSGTEKMVLVEYIRTNMGRFSLAEMRLAYSLAIQGKLDASPEHYQSFSPLYVENVMQSYNRYRFRYLRDHSDQVEAENDRKISPRESEELAREHVLNQFGRYRTGKEVIDFNSVGYRYLEQIGLINLSNEEKSAIRTVAERNYYNDLKDTIRTQRTGFIKTSMIGNELDSETMIRLQSRLLAMKQYFAAIRKQGIELKDLLDNTPFIHD